MEVGGGVGGSMEVSLLRSWGKHFLFSLLSPSSPHS